MTLKLNTIKIAFKMVMFFWELFQWVGHRLFEPFWKRESFSKGSNLSGKPFSNIVYFSKTFQDCVLKKQSEMQQKLLQSFLKSIYNDKEK